MLRHTLPPNSTLHLNNKNPSEVLNLKRNKRGKRSPYIVFYSTRSNPWDVCTFATCTNTPGTGKLNLKLSKTPSLINKQKITKALTSLTTV